MLVKVHLLAVFSVRAVVACNSSRVSVSMELVVAFGAEALAAMTASVRAP